MISENIVIECQSDSAVAGLANVARAQDSMTASQGRMRSEFGQRYEHIGLHIFGHQLLETAGISGQTRPIISAMTLAISSLGEAAGIATGGITLIAVAIAAYFAATRHATEEQEKLAKAAEEANKKLGEQFTKTKELTEALDLYEKAIGRLSPALKDLSEDAHSKLLAAQDKLIAADQASIRSIDDGIAKNAAKRESILANAAAQESDIAAGKKFYEAQSEITGLTEREVAQLNQLAAAMPKLTSERVDAVAALEAHRKGQASVNAEVAKGISDAADGIKAMEAWAKATDDAADAATKYGHDFAEGQWKMEEGAKKNTDEIERNLERVIQGEKRKQAALKSDAAEEMALHRAMDRAWEENERKIGAVGKAMQSAFSVGSAAVGNAFAQMAVHGKTWKAAFDNIFQSIEEAFISMLVQMTVKWIAFEILTQGMGASFIKANAILGTSFGGGQADGGDYMVSKPTLFLAGEAGPERATFTPAGKSTPAGWEGGSQGAQGGQGQAPQAGAPAGGPQTTNTTNISATVNVSGASDPVAVGREVIRQIRGMGQLDFVRAR